MDQRRLPLFLFLIFLTAPVHAEQIGYEPPVIIEATPLDPFSERADGWNYTERTADRNHSEKQGIYEQLSHIPGVTAVQETPRLSIRGSSSLARILGLYDGVPLNLADGFGFNNLLTPQESVGSLRIIKGPASVFWGKDAMGGAINMIPKVYRDPLVRVHGGSFGTRGAFAAVPFFRPSEKSSLQVTAFGDKTDGNFPYQSTSSGLTGTREPNDRATQRFTLRGEHTFGALKLKKNLIWAQEFGTSPGPISSPITTRFNRTAGLASLGAESQFSGGWRGAYRLTGLLSDGKFESTTFSSYKATRVANSASAKKIFSSGTSLELFADHYHDEVDEFFIDRSSHLANETETGALLAFPFSPNWVIRPGFRYVWSHQKFIPALGFFEEDGGFRRWLTYSHGFRVPALSQKYANTPTFVGNPDLKPETSEQIELGFQQKVAPDPARAWENYEYGVSVFSSTYKDFFKYDSVATPNRYVNLGYAEANGVEGNAGFNRDNWGARGEISYLKTEDNQKKPLDLAPEIQTLVNLHYAWALLLFELEHTLWGKYYESGTERVSWNTLDFHVGTVALQKWEIKASIFNIADSPREIALGYPEPGRRFWVSAGKSF